MSCRTIGVRLKDPRFGKKHVKAEDPLENDDRNHGRRVDRSKEGQERAEVRKETGACSFQGRVCPAVKNVWGDGAAAG